MKKINWRILLFILLAVLLAIGVSYLGFNQKVTKKDTPEHKQKNVHKMTIALVNEDQGSNFNGKNLNFGEKFVKSIEKDTEHEWFVVSRGVGESGLKRNIYNMEIVIPNDFSKKAISLTSKDPEKITVNYKVNDVGNNDLKIEAEKTASGILEDMNKRVIDVYFASILTNLQEAQDNIKEVVAKEKEYNNHFQNNVNAPISNYTKQFKTVQDYTGTSKESFKGFQELLTGYQKTLQEGSKANSVYNDQLQSAADLQVKNMPSSDLLTKSLDTFDHSLSADSIINETAALKQANQYLYTEFQIIGSNNSLLSQTQSLQNYIKDTNGRITALDKELLATLDSDLNKAVSEDLKRILQGEGAEPQQYHLNELTKGDINEGFKKKMASLIQRLPTFKPEDLQDLGLNESKYENIILLSKRFYNENHSMFPDDFYPNASQLPLQEAIDKVAAEWRSGKEVKSSRTTIPASEYETTFYLTLADGFQFDQITLVDDNNDPIAVSEPESYDYGSARTNGLKFTLPAHSEPIKVAIKANVHLQGEDSKAPLLGALDWNVMYQQKAEVQQPEPDPDPDPDPSTPENEKQTDDQKNDNPDNNGEEQPAPDENGEEGDTPDPTPPAPIVAEIPAVPIDTEAIPFASTQVIGKAFYKTLRDYEQLNVLYQLYYGLNPADNSTLPDLNDYHWRLDEVAKSSSYDYIFNNEDVIDKLIYVSSDKITKEYAARVQAFENRIKDYQSAMLDADNRSADLTPRLKQAVNEAGAQNDNLAKMLAELEAWREKSMELVDHNATVVKHSGEEKQAVMELGTNFSDLLMRSESLAEGAKGSMDSADGVYKTFDAIDKEAKAIQSSGKALIGEAAGLNKKLGEKLQSDQTFQKNFSNVMSNSRVGERQNEKLYDFLSNPVKKVNAGTILAGDKTTPYYTVVIFIIIALFTSYVIAYQEKQRLGQDIFLAEISLAMRNLPITFMAVGIAIAEGLTVGLITGKLFHIEEIGIFLWLGISILIMLTLVTVFTYLLRQLQMLGMFIILAVISSYLFLTDAVGMKVDPESIFAKIRNLSPLQYVEKLLGDVFGAQPNFTVLIYALIGVTAVFTTLNLFVWRKGIKQETEVLDDDL